MVKRFITIWFRHLRTDWLTLRRPHLRNVPFVLALPDHGRMVISAVNPAAQKEGIVRGIVVADARAIYPGLQVFDDKPEWTLKLLKALAVFCIRYTPVVAIDPPDGLIMDVSGCAHLWGSEEKYIQSIYNRLSAFGYTVSMAMADTIGAAWASSRSAKDTYVIKAGGQREALMHLPVQLLRLDDEIIERLNKLGLRNVGSFINMPRAALRRRFGNTLLTRLDQAVGNEEEFIEPAQPVPAFHERLPCLEPIITARGIEIGLQRLLDALCKRLQQEQKGIRSASFQCYRVDGKVEIIEIGTNRASHNSLHLFKLFELKLCAIEPGPGIELFVLQANKTEDVTSRQEKLWQATAGLNDTVFAELMDRIENKIGTGKIHRYLPAEHYWPERSIRIAPSVAEQPDVEWTIDRPRPIRLLREPEPIEVAAPIPDYPPMLFRYKGVLHTIKKADGPERIEQEWWLQDGLHRDYYCVEDKEGRRYWVFRSGHYTGERGNQWFIHGFFA